MFQPYFISPRGEPVPRDAVLNPLFHFNEVERRYLAHPVKAKEHGWIPTNENVKALEGALKMLESVSMSQAPSS